MESKERIGLIDAARGFCIILMLAYHLGFDLVYFGFLPQGALYNPLLNFLEPFFAGVFILISGIASRFSRSNIKRGLLVLAAAALVSLATGFTQIPVLFGILHFLGCAMLLYGLLGKFTDRLSPKLALTVYALLFVLFYILLNRDFEPGYFWWLGFTYEGFFSADFFPILPWIFVFWAGTALGRPIKEGRFPQWFYSFRFYPLERLGRHSLIIYLLHQPLLYGAVWTLYMLLN